VNFSLYERVFFLKLPLTYFCFFVEKDEFHTRLRYNRRGLVGMVNQGPNTNASQFFFTLGNTPELDKKNTLFGKVVGNTLFNMLKLGEGEIVGETPVRKQKVIKTEVCKLKRS